ncbi:hypothetical protein V2G26_013310 [Clonostachys chloroleuca]
MAIIWQDTLLSMAFGRNPSSHEMYHETDLPPLWQHSSEPAGLTYRQAMNWICHASMKYFVVPASPPESAVYNDIFRTFAEIQASCAKHIRERSECRSLLEVQEHYSFILHRNLEFHSFADQFSPGKEDKKCTNKMPRTFFLGSWTL